MKVHIVGGSGFLGSRVVRRLVSAGHEVTGLVRSEPAGRKLAAAGGTPVPGDISEEGSLLRALSSIRPEVLITSVSLGMGHGPSMVAAAEEMGVRRGVFVSTTSIFTKLTPASKATRLQAEERIRSGRIEWTIVRPTMIYGAPDDRNMARLLRFLRRTPAVPLPGGGRGLQQPVHVEDAAGAVVACVGQTQATGRTYTTAGPEALTLRQVILEAAEAVERKVLLLPVPLRPVVAAARLGERAGLKALRAEQIERLAEDKAFDITPAREDLDFDPRPFNRGVREEAEGIFGVPEAPSAPQPG